MKRYLYRNCIISTSTAILTAIMLLCAGIHDSLAQDMPEQFISAGFGSVEFQKAIDVVARSANGIVIKYDASLCAGNTNELDLKKVDVPARVTLSIQNQPIGKVLQAILNKAYTPLTYRRMGDVYTIIPDPTRKASVRQNKEGDVPEPGSQSFTFTNTPFDEAIDMLFSTYHLSYAIQPDVPFIRNGVTIVIANARAEEALAALLSSMSNAKTALTYSTEGGKYVIALKQDGTVAPELLAPVSPNVGLDLELSGVSLNGAINMFFRNTKANYFFVGSLIGKQPIVLQRHFDSEEAAVVAILRCAQPEPMLIYRKVGNLVTLLGTGAAQAGAGPVPTDITCHCTNADFGAVAGVILRTFHKNFRISSLLQHAPINLSLDHASFDVAFNSICKALPPNSVHQQDGMYDFSN